MSDDLGDVERYAKERLHELRLEYEDRAKPYIQILVAIEARRAPRILYLKDAFGAPVILSREHSA